MPRPPSDIQARVLVAARARFLSDGVDGASLRAIARDAGTSIGMVYYYFPTKDELFFGVVEDVYATLLEDLEAILAQQPGFEDRVRALYLRLARGTEVEADTVRLIVREAVTSSERFGRLRERFKRGHIALALRLVSEGRHEGAVAGEIPMPITAIAIGALGLMPQAILRAFGHASPESSTAMVDSLVRVLLGGVGAR